MDAPTFIAKWRKNSLTERSAAQQHFLDLCDLLAHPKPAEIDATGESFTFERGAAKTSGGDGWADVWKRGFFGWEYKGKHKDLNAAYRQLLDYREALENPPLLVVCDMERIIIHTNFTNTAKKAYDIPLEELGWPRNLELLRAVFFNPEKLKPGAVSETMTIEAAERIGKIALQLRDRGIEPYIVAHFLDRIIFCFFAEDIGLLPTGIVSRMLGKTKRYPERFAKYFRELFAAMAQGGDFLMEDIRHFNGNLFNDADIIALTREEIDGLHQAAGLDWSAVDPSIFGTLFERGMDPAKRAQLGAHYTGRADIETLVEPVVMTPLRREWDEVRQIIEHLLATGKKAPNGKEKPLTPALLKKARLEADAILHNFILRLERVTVLDPACGSGNFLYVTLQKLKDLEQEVIDFALARGFSGFFPGVGPWQLYGIEINAYAHDLAQMAVWIGYLQWTHAHGFPIADNPVLRRMNNFQCKDAILDLSDPEQPKEAEWPAVDYIVGNPPFLGDKIMRRELGDVYVDQLRTHYAGRIPGQSDLCCYWFEKARQQIADGKCQRAGLLATQGIRGGANREVLKRIKESGGVFFAISDREWVLDGANVHVSMVGFDNGNEDQRSLDGQFTDSIGANLSISESDITNANILIANKGISFIGTTKKGPFDISESLALHMLHEPNIHGKPNSDVIRPWANGMDVSGRSSNTWIIDFAMNLPMESVILYEKPYEYVKNTVGPLRENHREAIQQKYWWRLARPCPEMRKALAPFDRFIGMPRVSKYRLLVWLPTVLLPDCQVIVFARSDDYFFGVLHSRLHELWALKLGTRLETRPRYTPTTCFETFPFPRPTVEQQAAIATAAKELDDLRSNWLNPREWVREEVLEFPGTLAGPWARYLTGVDSHGIGTVRYPRLTAKDPASSERLAERTLTKLYNDRPAWLDNAHKRLDAAVFAAYGWDAGMSDDELLGRLLALNLERAREEENG